MHTSSSPAASHAERERNEAAFHDARIDDDGRKLGYAYASVKDLFGFTTVPRQFRHGSVLELGCFRGVRARALNGFPGRYTGIDISPAAVEHCKGLGLPANFEFRVDNANALDTVEDGEVDYAFGDGVLHHLDLASMAPALARKLSPNGCARFVEPAQGNFLLRMFRKLTPHLRTPDEHPFDRASIELLQRHFNVAIVHEALLRPLLPMLCLNSAWSTNLARRLDKWLLRHAFFQQQAWLLLIELRKREANPG
jgi:SAM-dependent methyltransferase